MRNALLLLCAVISAFLIASLFHRNIQKTWSLAAGAGLSLTTPCADTVTIDPDETAQGRVTITASARHQSEIDHLASSNGAGAALAGPPTCPEHQSLALTILVPPGLPLTITEAGGTSYNIGQVGGPLTLNLTGDGDLAAAAATEVAASLAGKGDVSFALVSGRLDATLASDGDLDIAAIAAPATNLTLNGSGDVNIAAGNVGDLAAILSHDGDLHIPAARSAKLTLTADGDVKIDKIAGDLAAILTGDGDLTVDRVGGAASIQNTGAGDVTIPHLAGKLTQSNTGDGTLNITGP